MEETQKILQEFDQRFDVKLVELPSFVDKPPGNAQDMRYFIKEFLKPRLSSLESGVRADEREKVLNDVDNIITRLAVENAKEMPFFAGDINEAAKSITEEINRLSPQKDEE